MNFLYTHLLASIINIFESNTTKFHKGLYAEMGKLGVGGGGVKYMGVQDMALKV